MKLALASPAHPFVASALVMLAIAPAAAWAQGSWSPVMDWGSPYGTGQVAAICGDPHAFAHAALIPTGNHRGHVMLWHCAGGGSTQIWVFNPTSIGAGNVLKVVAQSVAGDIFCAGQSWDSSGRLVIAGGFLTTLSQCYRFDPAALGLTIYPYPSGTGAIQGAPWTTLPKMTIERYYPTVIPLNRRAVTACGNSSLSSMNFVVGGPPTGSSQPGNDVWELVPQLAEPPFGCFMAPTGYQQSPVGIHEIYTTVNNPEPLLDSYPRAFQLSNDQIFVANDVATDSHGPHIHAPGQSWVITPRQGSAPRWKLTDGPDASTPGSASGQRNYGTAVLIHELNAKDRIFTFGGTYDTNFPNPPGTGPIMAVNNTMQEFRPGTNAANGTWTQHVPVASGEVYIGRMRSNSVILPTGQVLILGGSRQVPSEIPVFQPVLYTPGAAGTSDPGTAELMATSNNDSTGTGPTPRLYHSVAVMLQDASVFLAGGENRTGYPHSDYTGEVFTPPYPSYRPTITACPSGASLSGENFAVTVTPSQTDGTIGRVVLLRPAAVTHHFDNDQRLIELAFTTSGSGSSTTLTVTPPADNLGPAGWYMLFVLENGAQGLAPSTQGKFILFN